MKKAITIIMLLLWAVFSFSCTNDTAEYTCIYSGKSLVFSDGESGFSVYGGALSAPLKLINTEYEELSVTIYSDNGKSTNLSASRGGVAKAHSLSGKVAALTISVDGTEKSYALSQCGLELLLEDGTQSITSLEKMEIDGDLMLSYPLSLDARAELIVKGNIYYVTKEKGNLSISGSVTASGFASGAPLSHIVIPKEMADTDRDLYINALSLNGEELTTDTRIVKSEEALRELAKLPAYFDCANEAVVISDVALKNEVVVSSPCNLVLKNAELGGLLTIRTESEGKITLKGDIGYKDINIDAPNCHIEWDNPCTLSQARSHFNVKTLNSHKLSDYKLGGEGSGAIVSATMKSDGKLLTEDINWSVNGNTLTVTVAGVVAPSELKSAVLEYEVEGGEVKVDRASRGDNGGIDLLEPLGTYVSIVDSEGKARKYKIVTKIKSSLPVVVIETEDNAEIESREEYISATMSVESDFSDGLPSTDKAKIEIKGRGNSTWYWSDKKPYKVKYPADTSVLGLAAGKEWVLLANYNDKSLIRNYVALESAKILDNMDCTATQYPVDVYLNGEYIGVYSLGEQIEAGEGRVSIHSDATSVDTGFFMEIGGTFEYDSASSFSTRYMQYVEILEPSGSSLTDKHKSYIVNYMDMADDAVRSLREYEDYIDVDSLIDWLILTEVSFNSDGAMRRSVFFKKDHEGKIEMGPVWDFDIAYGNSNTDFDNYEAWCCLATDYGYVSENWICHLMRDEAFVQRLTDRWNEVKDELREVSLAAIDYGESIASHSAKANFKRWDILNTQVAIQPCWMVEYNTYEMQLDYLRDFINNRMDWIDSQLNAEERVIILPEE